MGLSDIDTSSSHFKDAEVLLVARVFFSQWVRRGGTRREKGIEPHCMLNMLLAPTPPTSTTLLCTKVANLGNGDLQSASPSLSAETDPSGKATIAIPCPDTEGFEDWIKARAAAVGVPVALEKERHAWCECDSRFV